ncbi:endonuclease/exonuclease/phosphatase family protein [Janthinobacterium fluminis]|uniref:Endonuclease/exonuclease/phosphatase family protein n=1 Tax=Janthinobacterium fluminis TaxID=2987524 RepID=A0ABT5K1G6_9BURK|nr:endonuclease/exonuclease/phosphatase family protein [Janthinobacterium fluminis]MDC8758828.1 endonuclease/exonuclease/phosphatase family protein [Janthinobacterium fluminis]
MQQEIRFATFNVCNLAPPGAKLYDNLEPLTAEQYAAKVDWTARQLDQLDADVVGLQEIFAPATLRDVLARSRRYRDAAHACAPAEPAAERLTPGVALVSRLPLAAPAAFHAAFPAGVTMPAGSRDADRFARPPLHAQIALADGRALDVVVVHLKSRRPDYRNGDCGDDPLAVGMANLRSLIRRGTEAVALRVLLAGLARDGGRPRVVLGDFNDVADAVTTSIVLGAGNGCAPCREPAGRMFDSNQIQSRQDYLRHVGYTNIHDGHYMTIDHILVSEEFNPASRYAIGEVLDVTYLNDHLLQALPQASDHGQVLARIRLYGARDAATA